MQNEIATTRLAIQHPQRSARRPRSGPGTDPRGHRLFHHRRGGPQGGALRLILYRHGDRLYRWPAGHDLRRHWRYGPADGDAGQGARPAILAGRYHTHRRVANHRRLATLGFAHALRRPRRDRRFRQRSGHPHLHGPIAGADQRQLGGLCHGRRRLGDHLSVPLSDQSGALATGGHRRVDRCGHRPRPGRPQRRRHGRVARQSAGILAAGRAFELGDPHHHLPGFRHPGRGGAVGIDVDCHDRRRPDRHQ